MINTKYIHFVHLTDIEELLSLGRQIKIPGYKIWKNVCSSGSFQSENQSLDKLNKTLYKYV